MCQLSNFKYTMEELELIVASVKQEMDAAIKHLEHAFQKIRAGRASTSMVQDVMVDYYGAPTPLSQVANVSVVDAMTLSIQPWDRTALGAIGKGIVNSNLGFAPSNNGDVIIINVPPLTEERRRDLAKQAKGETDQTKVTIRNARQEGNKELKRLEGIAEDLIKGVEKDIQELTDAFVRKSDELLKVKEAEILKV
ncbi:ribosome recycling factor [Epilithonimonas xixisoli]|uniref:Ribosome-recycling factor n=2 Tax=Epilithonimonas xixisoli TaxID=1476462 RepID=A0A4R8IED0_9FLAO|nr:ribosome recycling factor [Epilithonimonas xixisoli]